MEHKNRLAELRGDMSQKEFAESIGLTQQNYWKYENGKQGLKSDLIEKICRTHKCSAEWLLCLDDAFQGLPKGAIIPSTPRKAYAPLLGRVHAGDAQAPDIIEDNVALPYEIWDRHREGYFLQVEGNCMSKVYPEGCYIFVDRRMEPQNGSIAVVSIDGEDYVMRRLYRGANTMILSPDSWDDGYEDIVISGHDERTVEFVGVVVWFQASKEME